jgi:hypothetical protein
MCFPQTPQVKEIETKVKVCTSLHEYHAYLSYLKKKETKREASNVRAWISGAEIWRTSCY